MIETKTVKLEKIRFAIQQKLSEEIINFESIEFIESYMAKNVLAYYRAFLWGERERSYQVYFPQDWLEAFKLRWFPKILLKKWPVKYEIHTFNTSVVYPDMKISLPEKDHFVIISEDVERNRRDA